MSVTGFNLRRRMDAEKAKKENAVNVETEKAPETPKAPEPKTEKTVTKKVTK